MLLHKIINSLFEDFQSNAQGSGFYLSKKSCNLTVLRSDFINCRTSSQSGGGGFYASAQSVDVDFCTFSRCFAPDQGCAFLIDSLIETSSIECTSIDSEENFQEDGVFTRGSESVEFCYCNVTKIFGVHFLLTTGANRDITSYYRYVNVVNNQATGDGFFYSKSKITIESSNIANCSCPYFIYFFAPAGYLFSVVKSVITDSSFKTIANNNPPTMNNELNHYGSIELQKLFGELSGDVELNLSLLTIGCPYEKIAFNYESNQNASSMKVFAMLVHCLFIKIFY